MRLLQKLDIDLFKAKERKAELDEGRKLAEKVDLLRRTLPEEEARIKAHRDAVVAECQRDIEAAIARRRQASAEADAEEARGRKAMEPVGDLIEAAARRSADSDARFAAALQAEERALAHESEARNELAAAKALLEQAERDKGATAGALESAKAAEKEARKKLREAAEAKEAALRERDEAHADCFRREALVAERERNARLKEDSFAQRERALSVRERAIIDREETLQREFTRKQKNHVD